MKRKLVGFTRFISKKNVPTCIANVMYEFPQQQKDRGAVGCAIEQIFIPREQYDYLSADDLGKEIITTYDYVGGRAYLREVSVVRGKSVKSEE